MLLGEDDFRSFWRALELGNVLLLSQLHVTILVLWSQCRALGGLDSCPPSGLTVLVWFASSIFLGIDMLLWVDFNPPTVLPVLVECLMSSWPNNISFSISLVDSCPPTGLTVLDSWVFGFGLVRWVSLLLPATSESNSFIQLSLKEIVDGNLFANKDTSVALAIHSRSLSSDPHEMSLNIDMKMIRPVNYSDFSLFLTWTRGRCCRAAMWWILWIIPLEFHRLSVNCVQSSVLWWIFEPTQLLFPNSTLDAGFWFTFPRYSTESENT